MTPANRQRLTLLSKRIQNAAKVDAPAAVVMLQIFDWQQDLLNIACDLHMRDTENDRGRKKSVPSSPAGR